MEILVNFVKQNVFYFTYGIGITGIATLTLYFEQHHIITIDSEHYYTLTVSNFLLYLMTMISYIQCICIKHTLPPYIPQPRIKHQLKHNHQLYTYINYCDKQNKKYKPPRASHCHIDGCVARFDHHCPFIDNCVGIRNLKAFLLLGGYGAFSGLQFLVLSVFHYAQISSTGVSNMTEQQMSFWMTIALIDFFMTLALFSLFFGNLFTLTKNITKIDMLKGTFIVFDKEGMNPNPYDLGFLTNYALIFEGQLWKFWWPSELIPKYDGIKFEMIPTITSQDKKVLFANIQQMLKDPLERSIPSTMNQLIQQQNGKHKNIIYHHSNQTYEIPIHIYPQSQKIQQKAAVLEQIAASSFQDVQ